MALRILSSALLLILMPVLALGAPRPFVSGSLEEIRTRHPGPFLLVLWSLDCPPCRRELKLLGETLRAHPDLDLVLVATDTRARAEEAEQVLARYGLEQAENWIFASGNVQRLRYEIDPAWYGELPRTYFHLPDGQRIGISGPLRPAQIEAWLKTIK